MAAKHGPQNPELTRKRLLRAATIEFATKGLAGARIIRIAKNAGTNVQAIYYHFGNKDQLYAATVEAIFNPGSFDSLSIEIEKLDPESVILRLIEFMLDQYLDSTTEYALLIDARQVHTAEHLKKIAGVQKIFGRLLSQIDHALKQGAVSGVFRPGLDAARVFMTITSLTSNYIHKIHTHSALFGRDFASDDEFGGWCEHISNLILAGLRPLDSKTRTVAFPRSLKLTHKDPGR